MKRSSQIALVLMGATAVGTTGYAMMPNKECRPVVGAQQPASVRINPATGQAEPCRENRRSSSSSGSHWSSSSSSTWVRRSSTPSSTLTTTRPSGSSVPSTSSYSSTSVAARGGFGSTGHGVSSGSSGG
jgi:hypothetical protein